MKKLLIHSDNTSLLGLNDFQENNLLFRIPIEKDVDHYISELIAEQIKPEKPEVIFIKYALDDDYLAFYGLRLAHHIRLENSSCGLQTIPIVFVGEETVSELIRLSEYSDILATPGVYYVNEDIDKVKALCDRITQDGLKGLGTREDYINRVNLPAPLNFDSRHNYINELSLILWADYIGCDKLNPDLHNRIKYNLYFKYRIQRDKIVGEQKRLSKLPEFSTHAKVLLIDDEAKKGWEDFYRHLFSNSTDTIDFQVADLNNVNSQDDIIEYCLRKIESFDPDVILLDLRLSEKDVFETLAQSLTGYLLLERIKKINKGIQVIVTTASNKTSIFRDIYKIGADDYVIKNEWSEEGCQSLIKVLEKAINESKILKPLHCSLSSFIKEVESDCFKKIDVGEDSDHFYNELKAQVSIYLKAIQGLVSGRDNLDRFSLSVLNMHKILEVLVDYYIETNRTPNENGSSKNYQNSFYTGEETYYFVKRNNDYRVVKRDVNKRVSIVQQFYNLYYYFNKSTKASLFKELEILNEYRNAYAHSNLDKEFSKLEDLYEKDYKEFRKNFVRQEKAFFEYLNALI